MKEKKSNSVTHFEPETIVDGISVEFTRIVDSSGTVVNGRIVKSEMNVGDISYDNNNDFLILRLKPYSSLTDEETAAVHAAVPGYLKEMLS